MIKLKDYFEAKRKQIQEEKEKEFEELASNITKDYEQRRIEQAFEDLKQATVDFYEVSKREDAIKLEKIAKRKKLQDARNLVANIEF